MKGKKIAAAIACTALVAVVAVPLAACNKEEPLDLSNYAVEYSATPNPAITGLTQVVSLTTAENIYSNVGNLIIVRSGTSYSNYKYKAINVRTGATVFSDGSGLNSSYTYITNGKYLQYVYFSPDGSASSYTYYAGDGTLLISGVASASLDVSYNSTLGEYVLTVSGTSSASSTVTKTYTIDTSSDDLTLTSVTLDTSSGGLNVGDTYNNLIRPLYRETEKVNSGIADYSVAVVGNTYYFYDGGKNLTSTVNINNGEPLSIVDNYMYYYLENPVDSAKTNGYNYVDDTVKSKRSLHKYDILNGKDSEMKVDYVVTAMMPLYNSKDECYDAAVIYGFKMADGVATVGYNKFAYVVDKDLKVSYDISWYVQGSGSIGTATLYSLSDGYYALGSYIVNGSLTPVNGFSGSTSYFNEGLIPFTENGLTGFTDFEGKVVVTAKYSIQSEFYGGVAYARKPLADGKYQYVLLNKNGTETEVPSTASVSDDGYYYVSSNNSYSFYNFNGTLLQKFDSVTSVDDTITYGSYNCVKVQKSDGTSAIYKFV